MVAAVSDLGQVDTAAFDLAETALDPGDIGPDHLGTGPDLHLVDIVPDLVVDTGPDHLDTVLDQDSPVIIDEYRSKILENLDSFR